MDRWDSILGILFARDILALEKEKIDKKTINDLIRQPIYIPESQNLETLLTEFQTNNISIGMVMDEHGIVSGLVTVTDLVEEIIGELSDEFDVDPPEIFEIKDLLEKEGALYSSLSGTGSTMFGVYNNFQLAKQAIGKLTNYNTLIVTPT